MPLMTIAIGCMEQIQTENNTNNFNNFRKNNMYTTVHTTDYTEKTGLDFINIPTGISTLTIDSAKVSIRVCRDKELGKWYLWQKELQDTFGKGFPKFYYIATITDAVESKTGLLEIPYDLLNAIGKKVTDEVAQKNPEGFSNYIFKLKTTSTLEEGKKYPTVTYEVKCELRKLPEELEKNTKDLQAIVERIATKYADNAKSYLLVNEAINNIPETKNTEVKDVNFDDIPF